MSTSVAAHPQVAASNRDRVALQAFSRIASAWGLNYTEQRALLGGISKSTYERWRRHPEAANLTDDTMERISHALGIYKALHLIFTDPTYADRWLNEPNTRFGGDTAKTHMLANFTALVDLRHYLDAVRGS
jgi:uncharacterized protein (DUF2384 family)